MSNSWSSRAALVQTKSEGLGNDRRIFAELTPTWTPIHHTKSVVEQKQEYSEINCLIRDPDSPHPALTATHNPPEGQPCLKQRNKNSLPLRSECHLLTSVHSCFMWSIPGGINGHWILWTKGIGSVDESVITSLLCTWLICKMAHVASIFIFDPLRQPVSSAYGKHYSFVSLQCHFLHRVGVYNKNNCVYVAKHTLTSCINWALSQPLKIGIKITLKNIQPIQRIVHTKNPSDMYSKEKRSFPMLEPAMTEAGNTTQQAVLSDV